MTGISEESKEFATVERLGEMLRDIPAREPYRVTLTHALFTSILCWSVQRLRAPEHRTREAWERLEGEPVEDAPWSIPVDPAQKPQARGVGPFPEFQGFKAARLLVALRNAVAHGDDRRIAPWNRGDSLIGHKFTCVEMDERRRETFRGTIVLLREDMRRIGCALADRHCEAVNAASGHDLRGEARNLREAAR